MIISFCGHRNLSHDSAELQNELLNSLRSILNEFPDAIFYCGGYGDFDKLSSKVLDKLRAEGYKAFKKYLINPYPDEKINPSKMHLWHYDAIVAPEIKPGPPKYAIIRRNDWMVNQSDIIYAYVLHSSGGAARTLRYAWTKDKTVIRIGGNSYEKPDMSKPKEF